MIDARPWFDLCRLSWAEVCLLKEWKRFAWKCLTFRSGELCHFNYNTLVTHFIESYILYLSIIKLYNKSCGSKSNFFAYLSFIAKLNKKDFTQPQHSPFTGHDAQKSRHIWLRYKSVKISSYLAIAWKKQRLMFLSKVIGFPHFKRILISYTSPRLLFVRKICRQYSVHRLT